MSFHSTSHNLCISFNVFCVLAALSSPAKAEQVVHAHLLGGTTALVGGEDLDQLGAHPVSVAEVSFVAALLTRDRGNMSVDAAASKKMQFVSARRVAVLLRLLAQKARLLGERPRPEDVLLARHAVAHRLGGEDQVKALLQKFGVSPKAYLDFLVDLTLAKAQLAYVVESSTVVTSPSALGEPYQEGIDPGALEALRQFADAAVQDGLLRVLP